MSYLYRGSFENAKLSGEIEAYRENRSDNIRCKNAIEKAIADNFVGWYLSDTATKTVLADFGYDRTMWVLAASIMNKSFDGRFSRENKDWARSVIPSYLPQKEIREYGVDAPTPIARETLDEAVDIEKDKPSADRVPEDTKKELTAQVRQLSAEHDDSVAWLYIPDTNIDYPIMKSEDNDYYAHRAADGSYLYAGSLFMDYRNSSDFTDFNSIVYGHNMANGTMFADIPHYENEEYFMNHSYGWLTDDDDVRLIDFFAVARTVDTSGLYLADPNFQEWDSQLRNCASIYKEIGISADDHLITLSTCTSAEGNSRTVLVGKIIEESDVE